MSYRRIWQNGALHRTYVFRDYRADLLISRFHMQPPVLERPNKVHQGRAGAHTHTSGWIWVFFSNRHNPERNRRQVIDFPAAYELIMPRALVPLISLTRQYITFPNIAADKKAVLRDFHAIAGLPNITGAIYFTNIEMQIPSFEEFAQPEK